MITAIMMGILGADRDTNECDSEISRAQEFVGSGEVDLAEEGKFHGGAGTGCSKDEKYDPIVMSCRSFERYSCFP